MEMNVPGPVALAEAPALVVTPHPVSLQGQRILSAAAAEFTPGECLARLLERQRVLPCQQWVVTIDGCAVPEAMWAYTRPKHGHLIECRRVPQKDALRIIAVVALSYFTMGAGGMGAGGLFASGGAIGGGIFAAGAAFLAGSLVINKMLSPKMPGRANNDGSSPTYGLTAGGRNRARAFEPMGLVLGEPYAVPDLAAQPYTYFHAGEQYLWQIFHLGINCTDVTTVRIGQTPIGLYQGVKLLRNGLASDNTNIPSLGSNVDVVAGAALQAPGWPGDWTVRTSSPDTVILSLDFVSQLFSIQAKTGAIASRYLHLEIFYRELGTTTWLPFTDAVAEVPAVTEQHPVGMSDSSDGTMITVVVVPGVPGVAAGTLRLSNASQAPLRSTVEKLVSQSQYEVRVRKYDPDESGTMGSNAVEWTQLRSFQRDGGNYDGQARLAVQIQASGQLNGSLDELNGLLRAKPMPYWNGSSWVTATDRSNGLCNPGAIFLQIARGFYDGSGRRMAGLGYSDEQIDIEGLKRFMVRCQAKGFEFDHFVQETMSLQDVLNAVAYAGLGEVSYPDGKLGVVFFSEDDPVEGVINMANIRARSFSVEYETMPTADELEIQYFDRNRGNVWTSLLVTAPGVSNPRSTARMQLIGVTKESQAAVLGRFVMAQNLYQLKTISLEQDLEYMTYRRGAVVSLSHDLTQWGYSGRLVAAQDAAGQIHLTLDERAPGAIPPGGSGRFIGLRLPGETAPRIFPVQTFTGESRSVVLDAPWPVGVPLPGSTADNPAHDTLWIYDFKAVPGQRLLVSSIEPNAGGARLSLVPIGQEFWDYVFTGAYSPPPSSSLLMSRPVVDRVRVDETLARQGNTYFTELSLSMEVSGPFSRAELWGGTGDGDFTPPLQRIAQGQSQTLRWRGGLDERWHLELRVFSDTQQAEPYRVIYDVLGQREAPPPFDQFTVLAQPDGTRQFNFAYTTTEPPADWLGSEIRYLVGTYVDPEWDSMLPLQEDRTHYTASPIEVNQLLSGAHTFACRSLDTTGNPSEPRYFQLTLPPRRLGNVVQEIDDRAEGWLGSIVGGEINTATGGIEAIDTSTWSAISTWDEWTRWSMSPQSTVVYTSPVRDLTAVITFLIDVSAAADGTQAIAVRSSETSDDPIAMPGEWTSWGPADVKVVARYFQIRLTVEGAGGSPVSKIDQLAYVVSAPVLNEYVNDCDISALSGPYRIGAGDVRVPLANTYSTLLELQVVIQDASSGTWSWQVLDKTLAYGPRVQFKLNGTLSDPDLVDFIVKGF